MRPKLFARNARFQAALESKARFATRSWTEVAHDFAEFTGGTPTETLTELETVFVEQIKMMRSGAASAKAVGNTRLILRPLLGISSMAVPQRVNLDHGKRRARPR
ncbi:MAG: hypothetical protein WA869_01900 [Alloacidobacterium sp.]|jgi:hypothetical protein